MVVGCFSSREVSLILIFLRLLNHLFILSVLEAMDETLRHLRPFWPILGGVAAPPTPSSMMPASGVAAAAAAVDDLAAVIAQGWFT